MERCIPWSARWTANRAGRDAADLSDAAVVWIISPIDERQPVRGGIDDDRIPNESTILQ